MEEKDTEMTYRGKRLAGTVRARKEEFLGTPPSLDGKNSKLLTGSVLKKGVRSWMPPTIIYQQLVSRRKGVRPRLILTKDPSEILKLEGYHLVSAK